MAEERPQPSIFMGLIGIVLLIGIVYVAVAQVRADIAEMTPSSQEAMTDSSTGDEEASTTGGDASTAETSATTSAVNQATADPVAEAHIVAAFNKGGCAGCHVIPGVPGANGQVGPDLSQIGVDGATRIDGYAAADYIHESIVDPNAFIAPDCPTGPCPANVMLQSFAQTLSAEELESIVGYLAVLGTDEAAELAAAPEGSVALDATLPPESVLEPFMPLPKEPASEAQIALGKYLFFDTRLSNNNSSSCATCHQPDLAFTDGEALNQGYPSTHYFRNAPTLYNTVFGDYLYWDGRMDGSDMPTLVRDHITEAHFMSNDGRLMVERINQVPAYVDLFNETFGSGPGFGRILNAITAYVQTLNSPPVAYDRHLAGEADALSEDAQAGLALFEGKAGCSDCHGGALLSDSEFYNIGVATDPAMFEDPELHLTFRRFFRTHGTPNYRALREDVGLYAMTLEEEDRGKFHTPSLREVGRTAPYMHNGTLATLEDVVRFYNNGGGAGQTAGLEPLGLSDEEVGELVVFLESLSSEASEVAVPTLPNYQIIQLGTGEQAVAHEAAEETTAGGDATGAPTASIEEVTAVVTKGTCGACHIIAGIPTAVGVIGPDLSNIGTVGATRIEGYTAEEYIRESIVDPNVFIAPECPAGDCLPGLMLPNLADILSAEELDLVVQYLASSTGGGE